MSMTTRMINVNQNKEREGKSAALIFQLGHRTGVGGHVQELGQRHQAAPVVPQGAPRGEPDRRAVPPFGRQAESLAPEHRTRT